MSSFPPGPPQEDVDQFMKQPGNGTVELVLKRFDEQYKKYKFLEANLVAKRKRYATDISQILWYIVYYQGNATHTRLSPDIDTAFIDYYRIYCNLSARK